MLIHLLHCQQSQQNIQAILWFLEMLRLGPSTGQVQTNKTSRCGKCLVFPRLETCGGIFHLSWRLSLKNGYCIENNSLIINLMKNHLSLTSDGRQEIRVRNGSTSIPEDFMYVNIYDRFNVSI
jgi:hypothetical protein